MTISNIFISAVTPGVPASPGNATGTAAAPTAIFDLLLPPENPAGPKVAAGETDDEAEDSDTDGETVPNQAEQVTLGAMLQAPPATNVTPVPITYLRGGGATTAPEDQASEIPAAATAETKTSALASSPRPESVWRSQGTSESAAGPSASLSDRPGDDERRPIFHAADFAAPQKSAATTRETIPAISSPVPSATTPIASPGSTFPWSADADAALVPERNAVTPRRHGTSAAKGGVEMIDAPAMIQTSPPTTPTAWPATPVLAAPVKAPFSEVSAPFGGGKPAGNGQWEAPQNELAKQTRGMVSAMPVSATSGAPAAKPPTPPATTPVWPTAADVVTPMKAAALEVAVASPADKPALDAPRMNFANHDTSSASPVVNPPSRPATPPTGSTVANGVAPVKVPAFAVAAPVPGNMPATEASSEASRMTIVSPTSEPTTALPVEAKIVASVVNAPLLSAEPGPVSPEDLDVTFSTAAEQKAGLNEGRGAPVRETNGVPVSSPTYLPGEAAAWSIARGVPTVASPAHELVAQVGSKVPNAEAPLGAEKKAVVNKRSAGNARTLLDPAETPAFIPALRPGVPVAPSSAPALTALVSAPAAEQPAPLPSDVQGLEPATWNAKRGADESFSLGSPANSAPFAGPTVASGANLDAASSRPMTPAAVVEEVGLGLERIQQHGNGRMDLHLSLEGGQSVSIELQVRDGAVHASFLTGSAELREALEKGWSQLAGRSESIGLPLVAPIFKAPPASSMNAGQQDFRERHNEPQQERPAVHAPFPDSPAPKRHAFNSPRTSTTTGLNTWA